MPRPIRHQNRPKRTPQPPQRTPEPAPEPATDPDHEATLVHIAQVSKNARTTWFAMLGVLVFGAIAVAGVEDRDFFTYGVETELPLVGVTVPTVPFFVAAPILILAIYTYLHLYLLKLWRGLAAVPATAAVAGERKPRGRPLGWLTTLVSLLLAWLAGPLVLGLFWARSWPYHAPVLTLYLAGLTLAAIWIGTFTFFRARRGLLGGPRTWRIVLAWLCAALIVLSTAAALPFYSWMKTVGNISGLEIGPLWRADLYQAEIVARPEDWLSRGEAEEVFLAEYGGVSRRALDALLAEGDKTGPPKGESLDWLEAARGAFKEQRENLLLSFDKLDLAGRDLRRADLRDAFLPGIRLPGARLGGADMSGAQMEGVVFSEFVNGEQITADLAGAPCDQDYWDRVQPEPPEIPPARAALGCTRLANAHLEGAALSWTDLSGADLNGANLSGADLSGANLSGATLGNANLSGAALRGANLSGAVLSGANLSDADLLWANLSGATLGGANLSGAALRGANLSGAGLAWANLSGTDLEGANLSGADLRRANLSDADLFEADLSDAGLSGANLSGADLRWANLSGADLGRANLRGADLGDLRGVEGWKLEGAIGDDQTRLPPRWLTPHVIATCYGYDTLEESAIYDMARSWRIDEATFRARYVCPEGTPPGRIEGAGRAGGR